MTVKGEDKCSQAVPPGLSLTHYHSLLSVGPMLINERHTILCMCRRQPIGAPTCRSSQWYSASAAAACHRAASAPASWRSASRPWQLSSTAQAWLSLPPVSRQLLTAADRYSTAAAGSTPAHSHGMYRQHCVRHSHAIGSGLACQRWSVWQPCCKLKNVQGCEVTRVPLLGWLAGGRESAAPCRQGSTNQHAWRMLNTTMACASIPPMAETPGSFQGEEQSSQLPCLLKVLQKQTLHHYIAQKGPAPHATHLQLCLPGSSASCFQSRCCFCCCCCSSTQSLQASSASPYSARASSTLRA